MNCMLCCVLNASDVPRDLPPGCSAHMINHNCAPNGDITTYVPDQWDNDLVLLVFISTKPITKGTEVTFQSKGDMWRLLDALPSVVPSGFRRIRCRCANPCPNIGRFGFIERRIRRPLVKQMRWCHSRDAQCNVSHLNEPADISSVSA